MIWIALVAVDGDDMTAEEVARLLQRQVEGPGHRRVGVVKRIEDQEGQVHWTSQDGFKPKNRRPAP